MNRKITHTRDEHEGYNLTLFNSLIPSAAKQVANKGGDVTDIHIAVSIHVARLCIYHHLLNVGEFIPVIYCCVDVFTTTRHEES